MGLSCLTDPTAQIIADTSTVINLNASGRAGSILRAIPNQLIVTDVVVGELQFSMEANAQIASCRN
jgi:predicted nucleic acid-binding protein